MVGCAGTFIRLPGEGSEAKDRPAGGAGRFFIGNLWLLGCAVIAAGLMYLGAGSLLWLVVGLLALVMW
jgi:hypothetical protein